MERKPMSLVSVIIPVYNVERYLPRCVDSVLAQSYAELQILLVDDGATDRSGELCDEYAKRDARVEVLHEKNAGPSAARNKGLAAARGEYIAFVDSDDYVHPNMLRDLLTACIETGCKLAACGYRTVCGDEPLDEPERGVQVLESLDVLRQSYRHEDLKYLVIWNKLYHRDVVEGLRFDESLQLGEDHGFSHLAVYRSGRMAWLSGVYYAYFRANEHSLCRSGLPVDTMQRVEAYRMERDYFRKENGELYELACVRMFKELLYLREESAKRRNGLGPACDAQLRELALRIKGATFLSKQEKHKLLLRFKAPVLGRLWRKLRG